MQKHPAARSARACRAKVCSGFAKTDTHKNKDLKRGKRIRKIAIRFKPPLRIPDLFRTRDVIAHETARYIHELKLS